MGVMNPGIEREGAAQFLFRQAVVSAVKIGPACNQSKARRVSDRAPELCKDARGFGRIFLSQKYQGQRKRRQMSLGVQLQGALERIARFG